MVLRAIPVILDVKRMLLPSTKAAKTLIRASFASEFILSIMLECNSIMSSILLTLFETTNQMVVD